MKGGVRDSGGGSERSSRDWCLFVWIGPHCLPHMSLPCLPPCCSQRADNSCAPRARSPLAKRPPDSASHLLSARCVQDVSQDCGQVLRRQLIKGPTPEPAKEKKRRGHAGFAKACVALASSMHSRAVKRSFKCKGTCVHLDTLYTYAHTHTLTQGLCRGTPRACG